MRNRIQRESDFHNKIYEDSSRQSLGKYYSITKNSRDFYKNFLKENCTNKKALEYGCGEGSYSYYLADNNAHVTGIDISEFAIQEAIDQAKEEKLNIDFKVMNAEDLDFDDDSFDLICGTGILHHLDLNKSLEELSRTLSKDGKAIFIEPLGHNFVINFFRRLTPNMRSEDEHPLLEQDIKSFNSYFKEVNTHYYHLFSLAAVPFRNTSFFNIILNLFDSIDSFIFKYFPFMRKNAWMVIIIFTTPIKQSD